MTFCGIQYRLPKRASRASPAGTPEGEVIGRGGHKDFVSLTSCHLGGGQDLKTWHSCRDSPVCPNGR